MLKTHTLSKRSPVIHRDWWVRYLTWREARNTGFLRLIETIDDQRYVRKTGLCFSSSHCSGRAQVRIPAAGDCRPRFLLQAR
jgi:hypothetical protein